MKIQRIGMFAAAAFLVAAWPVNAANAQAYWEYGMGYQGDSGQCWQGNGYGYGFYQAYIAGYQHGPRDAQAGLTYDCSGHAQNYCNGSSQAVTYVNNSQEQTHIQGAEIDVKGNGNYLGINQEQTSVESSGYPARNRGLPRGRRYADDRAPTREEIKKLCEYPDRRIKPLVYTKASSGIRVGAWDYLHWGNIQPIEKDSKIVAARVLVYAGEEGSYITYITPSAYRELAEWMKYREESGEIITADSWVMRDLWDTRVKISRGLIAIPKKLTAMLCGATQQIEY